MGCDEEIAIPNVINMYTKKGITAIIGGRCSDACEKTGLYLAYWNVAFFPESCSSQYIANKASFKTIVRIGSVQHRLAEAFVDLFRYYKWRKAVMVAIGSSCKIFAEAIQAAFEDAGISVAEYVQQTEPNVDIDNILKRIRDRSKVVTICMGGAENMNEFFLKAMEAGMTNGQYAYISHWFFPSQTIMEPWHAWQQKGDVTMVRKLKTAMMGCKVVTGGGMYGDVMDDMRSRMKSIEDKYNLTNQESSPEGVQMYEATFSYLSLVHEALKGGLDPTDGHLIQQLARNKTFQGYSSHISFDNIADRKSMFNVYDIKPDWEFMRPFIEIDTAKPVQAHDDHLLVFRKTVWAEGVVKPPNDPDDCDGNDICNDAETEEEEEDWVIPVAVTLSLAAMISSATAAFVIRRRRIEAELHEMIWKIDKRDIVPINRRSMSSCHTDDTPDSSFSNVDSLFPGQQQLSRTVLYKGTAVVFRRVNRESGHISTEELTKLRQWKLQTHENLVKFFGACLEPLEAMSISEYCPKGSLMDILQNDSLNLDWSFKSSFITDLVSGMRYLHNTSQMKHGNLSSEVCMIDSRWTLKISGFDLDILPSLRRDSYADLGMAILWNAPEVLRNPGDPAVKTKSSDVYSFAIILQEIITRDEAYFIGTCPYTAGEVIERVREIRPQPFRPQMDEYGGNNQNVDVTLMELMYNGWHENPDSRPTFDDAAQVMAKLNNGRKTNLLDDMVHLLEKYTSELECQVQEHTLRLIEEKKRTEELLHSMLPRPVAEKLVSGESVVCELFDNVTIYFSDVVGFSEMCTRSHPIRVISLLNEIYTICDNIIAMHDVYKVETVSDCYLVAGGLFNKGSDHMRKVAQMAVQLLMQVGDKHRGILKDNDLMIRIGIHAGPCAAGIVGLKMPKYCLFGDTVNVASRMQTTGEGMKIHLSSEAQKQLMRFTDFQTESRGTLQIKGKGLMETFWLTKSSEGSVPSWG